ncbi:MAG: response regulator [Deltaproteobacteria bacterium]|nr:response regulator [Deltaproteobacteria bacterium]
MPTGTSHGKQESAQLGLRLGGARADFVAGLGRKVGELRQGLDRIRQEPDDLAKREDLRRKIHALSSGAKIMKFDAMERALAEAAGIIDRSAIDLPLDEADIEKLDQLLEDLPALAWGDSDGRSSRVEPIAKKVVPQYSCLVVGPAMIGEALLEPSERATFTCESTPDTQAAFDIARATEPDLVVLDADLEYSTELVDALMDDPVTEGSPIVVVGSFLAHGEAARYVAMGVAKTLAKPTSREALRNACVESLEALRVEMCSPVPAEVRVSQKGEGISIAPPPEVDPARSDRQRVRARGPAVEVRLQGRRVVVADDDPAVVWFVADLLKQAGCTVHEAFDGKQALELAFRTSPDLVITDILMPELDGFTLCRTLRRDVALRDVPVVLLSWKEDLLQRVRELGVGAAGYIRKESDGRAILARVREALRPRARIEMRIRDDDGEVRGRMDGMTVRTLLETVCAMRPEARVSVRDATFNYEIEIRDGAPHRAIRTAGDGTFQDGSRVLAAMLGVGAGRFTVSTSTASKPGNLDGNLPAQLAKPIARARASMALLLGKSGANVARVVLDEEGLDDYLRATPTMAQDIARRIQKGTPPRALVVEGVCEPSLVEDLVGDLAARGIVTGIEDAAGNDLLGPEITRFVDLTDGRASFAPRTNTTPEPTGGIARFSRSAKAANDCAADEALPQCESPMPSSALEESARTMFSSPEPAQLGLPLVQRARVNEPEPSIAAPQVLVEEEGTPPHDHILALGEATIVDDTVYGEKPEGEESDADAIEVSQLPPESDSPVNKTPFTAVKADEPAGVPKKRAVWPMAAFVVATGAIAWAVMHFSFAGQPTAKANGRSAPPAETATSQAAPLEDVTYTNGPGAANASTTQGSIEISAPGDSVVLVDGAERGRGTATVTMPAGRHEVRISGPAGESSKSVEIRAGKVAHVKF